MDLNRFGRVTHSTSECGRADDGRLSTKILRLVVLIRKGSPRANWCDASIRWSPLLIMAAFRKHKSNYLKAVYFGQTRRSALLKMLISYLAAV
jgi:hypothetical protein